jgi:hypothetical protein
MALSEPSRVCASSDKYMPQKRARSLVLDSQGENAKRKRALDWLNSNLAAPKQSEREPKRQTLDEHLLEILHN